ncbi:S-layer homology domain-containing protein [Anaeromicropila populeti]|uniref:S-layer homology domain-containing protein n=1 Tax=Anaeromicropila populeti TaxID=37658 RepID=A0A1I6IWC8_9FIRM|nr:S-layer homology domain-containing protein [Anaeromicropila populeti]SFR71017.1 S-layer homology domain-containing protein [Anaeromicropila populeti]
MKKKIFVFILVALCIFPCISSYQGATVNAASTDTAQVKRIISLMGILNYSETSSYYSKKVTRAQFAKLLVKASSYKDQVQTTVNTALYKDVTVKNAYAGYIKIAVKQGWMTGYSNGKFKPNQAIKLSEAAKAVVNMLGYTSSIASENTMTAKLSKFYALNLDENIAKTKNQALTRLDCVNLFYNSLNTKTNEGKIYAEILGYSLDTTSKIDYLSLLTSDLQGPVLVEGSWKNAVPFDTTAATVYRNEVKSKLASIAQYDVVYYSKNTKTLWAYSTKVTGELDTVTPNRLSPQAITVDGTSYQLGTQDMVYRFSSLGDFSAGDTITIFLGMNNQVAAAKFISEYSPEVSGVVLQMGTEVNSDTSAASVLNKYIVIADENGNKVKYNHNYTLSGIEVGDVVNVTYVNGEETIKEVTTSTSKLECKSFASDGSKLGDYQLAEDVKILDINGASYQVVTKSDVASLYVDNGDVLYYEMNTSDKIAVLFLNNVTGLSYSYGIVTKMGSNTVTYSVDGVSKTENSDNIQGSLGLGMVYSIYEGDDGFIFSSLSGSKVISLSSSKVETVSWTKAISSDVVVYYITSEDEYYTTNISNVSDLTKYSVTAYYDSRLAAAKQVRVLVARDI